MRRGKVRLVDLDPVRGSDNNRRRLAVVVSNDRANAVATRHGQGTVAVVPLSRNTDTVFPFQVLIPASEGGLPVDSKAQAEQVRSVPVEQLGAALGRLPATTMDALEEALRLHLDL